MVKKIYARDDSTTMFIRNSTKEHIDSLMHEFGLKSRDETLLFMLDKINKKNKRLQKWKDTRKL